MADFQLLLRRQRYLRMSLLKIQQELEAQEPNATDAATQITEIDTIVRNLREVEGDVAINAPEEDLENQITQFSDMKKLAGQLRARLNRLIPAPVAAEAAAVVGNPVQDQGAAVPVKLPKLDIPKFSGNLLEWQSFHDRFKVAVHDQNYKGATKLIYLKDALVGDAADLLRSTDTTDENYNEAWEAVIKRFKNSREIAKAHLDRLIDQPTVSSPYAASLRKLVDITNECMRSLKSMGAPTDQWDLVISFLICRKLDRQTRQQWELQFNDDSFPVLKELLEFLDKRAKALAVSEEAPSSNNQKPKQHGNGHQSKSSNAAAIHQVCACDDKHPIYKCPKFREMSIGERKEYIRSKRFCSNCLRSNHRVEDCKDKYTCRKCKGKHNTLLHEDKPEESTTKSQSSLVVERPSQGANTLLATAVIRIKDSRGQFQEVRALLDTGSELTLISEDCVQRLGLKKYKANMEITGVGATKATKAQSAVSLTVGSRYDKTFILCCEGLVLRRVTGDQPNFKIDDGICGHIQNLPLADPKFKRTSRVDVLLSAAVVAEAKEEGMLKGPAGTPLAEKTSFGWIVYGSVGHTVSRSSAVSLHACCNLDAAIRDFLEYDSIGEKEEAVSVEEDPSEVHFRETHTRDGSGRYVVRLPFKNDPQCLGDSRKRALRTLLSSEKRLLAKPGMYERYNAVLQEYMDLGHMELVPHSELNTNSPKFYLPHHGVIKESSTTTKLRVVFNASAKTTSGISLNEILMVGPRIQDDLFSILVRVRKYPIMLSSDVEKMYRMVLCDEKDRDFQRILWRPKIDQPIREYRLKTVTFGEASAPFQAVRAMNQCAIDYRDQYPRASEVVLRDFYVDNAITGANSIEEAMRLQEELTELLNKGGFPLRKWSSNEPKVLDSAASHHQFKRKHQGSGRPMVPSDRPVLIYIKTIKYKHSHEADHTVGDGKGV